MKDPIFFMEKMERQCCIECKEKIQDLEKQILDMKETINIKYQHEENIIKIQKWQDDFVEDMNCKDIFDLNSRIYDDWCDEEHHSIKFIRKCEKEKEIFMETLKNKLEYSGFNLGNLDTLLYSPDVILEKYSEISKKLLSL